MGLKLEFSEKLDKLDLLLKDLRELSEKIEPVICYRSSISYGGQVLLSEANKKIKELEIQTDRKWKKCFSDILYIDDMPKSNENPIALLSGYCWIIVDFDKDNEFDDVIKG
jgi:hypothetical protein